MWAAQDTHYSSFIIHFIVNSDRTALSAQRLAHSAPLSSFHRHHLLLPKHILIKPFPVMPDGSEAFLGFIDAVTEAFVYDQPGRDTSVLQATVQLIGIGYGYPLVKFSVLDQGRRTGLVDIGHG